MSDVSSFDREAYRLAVASVRRHSMETETWRHTVIGELHPNMAALCQLSPGELAIASGFFSNESWWLVSTRRIAGQYSGVSSMLDPRFGVQSEFGNFKGIKRSEAPGASSTEVATVTSAKSGELVRFEFETGKASMALIYACMFWSRVTRFHYGENGA